MTLSESYFPADRSVALLDVSIGQLLMVAAADSPTPWPWSTAWPSLISGAGGPTPSCYAPHSASPTSC